MRWETLFGFEEVNVGTECTFESDSCLTKRPSVWVLSVDSDEYRVTTDERSHTPRGRKEARVWDKHGQVNWEGMNKQKLKTVKFTYRFGGDGRRRKDVSGFRGIKKPEVSRGWKWVAWRKLFKAPRGPVPRKLIHLEYLFIDIDFFIEIDRYKRKMGSCEELS